ncbi:MAG: sulfotransferase [Gammaproteobacteria bacterium]|nr:sulfotransferase [Gammaproteobacteria bacterium]
MNTGNSAAGVSCERIFTGAQIITGVSGVNPGLRARVDRIVARLNQLGPQPPQACVAAENQLRALLVTRLRLERDRHRIPAIAAEVIARPIFVIGFSRTGTSLLHSLLAQDEASRAPRWWQTHSPSPPPGELPVTAQRLADTARELERFLQKTPGLLTLHPYWDEGPQSLIEDEEIATLDFQNVYPSLLFDIPGQEVMGSSFEPPGAHEFQKHFLQHQQWNTPRKHWVAKGIYHQFALRSLFETFPDALCLWPHRDPAVVQASTLTIATVVYGGINDWDIDPRSMAQAFVHGARDALESLAADPIIDDPRIVHVQFDAIAADPIAIVRNAYSQWGLPYSTAFENAMRRWLQDPANRSDRYGRYDYSLVAFGVDAEQVRRMFPTYRKRFGLN